MGPEMSSMSIVMIAFMDKLCPKDANEMTGVKQILSDTKIV